MLSAPNVAGLSLEIPATSSCHSKCPQKKQQNQLQKKYTNKSVSTSQLVYFSWILGQSGYTVNEMDFAKLTKP